MPDYGLSGIAQQIMAGAPKADRQNPIESFLQAYSTMQALQQQKAAAEVAKKAAIMDRVSKLIEAREMMGPEFASQYAEQVGAPQLFARPPQALPGGPGMGTIPAQTTGATGSGLEPAFLQGADQMPFAATRAMQPSRTPEARQQQYRSSTAGYGRAPVSPMGSIQAAEMGRQPVGQEGAAYLHGKGLPAKMSQAEFAKILPSLYTSSVLGGNGRLPLPQRQREQAEAYVEKKRRAFGRMWQLIPGMQQSMMEDQWRDESLVFQKTGKTATSTATTKQTGVIRKPLKDRAGNIKTGTFDARSGKFLGFE